jgi:uncharacterized protein (TIGR02466 family)
MPIDTWFPLAIYREDLRDAAQHKAALIQAIQDLEARGFEPRNFPEMAWTGDIHGVSQVHRDRRFRWVVDQVEAHSLRYLSALNLDLTKVDLYIQRAWPIVSRPGQSVGVHSHHTAHISAVYYVSVPNSGSDESGSLIFVDDARFNDVTPGLGSQNTDILTEWNELNLDQAAYAPIEGRLILFPAKQRHAVMENQSEGDRLSLSFDIILTARSGQDGYEFLTPPPTMWQPFGHGREPQGAEGESMEMESMDSGD